MRYALYICKSVFTLERVTRGHCVVACGIGDRGCATAETQPKRSCWSCGIYIYIYISLCRYLRERQVVRVLAERVLHLGREPLEAKVAVCAAAAAAAAAAASEGPPTNTYTHTRTHVHTYTRTHVHTYAHTHPSN